ncbi:MAG: type IV secretory system conjugative DNA transfer family protein [Oscillospiraceae bacterium]|nr:type IV secretory system conjugative DNA transfer family protein [Oscillospiraceae bacterium]
MNEKHRRTAIIFAASVSTVALLYIGGLLGQLMTNYNRWMDSGGMMDGTLLPAPDFGLFACLIHAFSLNGIKSIFLILAAGAALILYLKLHDKFSGTEYDPRGFTKSKTGIYGTASWMTDKELKSVLELTTPDKATGMILGEQKGQLVCLPENTRLNRHCAIFGASGTMKSRAIIRNALFSAIRRGESVLISDPKSEMYSDTAELFRNYGYEVKVLNLVAPKHGDSWNCMSDLNGDTMMAQVLTNVIIGNTSSGKGDHFWDNGESNLLKALVLYTDLDKSLTPERKNLAYVYQLLTRNSEKMLTAMFEQLPMDHPARAPFNLFSQSSDTVKSGIILGLGTRLQVLQNEAVKQLVSFSDIDLTAPGKRKCAYYIILSDQETSMAFLSSLFFSFLFIKLTRFADNSPDGRCPVPVNLILDEFNNIGRIGGAPDGSDFCRSLSVIRSRDIRVTIAVQSLGQLQNRYPNNLWAEIIGNCDIQLMLGCTDEVTADYISDRSGDMSIQVDSTMTVKKTVAIAQVIPQYRETQGQGKRKLLTPDEVLRLPHDEMLVIIRGQNILKLNKFDYTRHPMSREMVRISIMDYHPRTGFPIMTQTDFESTPEAKPRREQTGRKLSRTDVPPVEF